MYTEIINKILDNFLEQILGVKFRFLSLKFWKTQFKKMTKTYFAQNTGFRDYFHKILTRNNFFYEK